MCKKKRDISASNPIPNPCRTPTTPTSTATATTTTKPSSSSSNASTTTLSVKDTLPDSPVLYSLNEIHAATNNFLSNPLSSSSWRCILRSKSVTVHRRPFRGDAASIPSKLASLCKSHHRSLSRLLGASLASDSIFLVYSHSPGETLANCLRNPRNPSFTPLSTWISRIQIAVDVAQGLEYVHDHSSGAGVHNRLDTSSVIISSDLRAVVSDFGSADLTGEMEANPRRIEGTRGYISPEVAAGAAATKASDVYAFGVLLLEVLTGEEPMRYVYERGRVESVSVVETAKEVVGADEEEERKRRVRRWVDRRLKDSFPVEVAEKVVGLAVECVGKEAVTRPGMERIAGKLSRLLIRSRQWADQVKLPTDFSVSMTPR